MGFLGLIAAEKLQASYDTQTRLLTLSAQGQAQDYTSGIIFERMPWMGGLRFQLEGWTGPTTGSKSAYSHEQVFPIQLPSSLHPSGTVTIVDANNMAGVVVPILFQGSGAAVVAADPPGAADSSSRAIDLQQPLNAFLKQPFQIKESAEVPKFGTVNVKFDSTILELLHSGIESNDVVWTFSSLKTGDTQVVITITGGVESFTVRKVYVVQILAPDQGPATSPD